MFFVKTQTLKFLVVLLSYKTLSLYSSSICQPHIVTIPIKGRKYFRNRNLRGIRYEIKFRTNNDSGLLMWRRKIGIRPKDFIGLGLSDGKLHLIYTDTDTKEVNSADHEDWFQSIESKNKVDDGLWHTASVRRRKRLAMLQVDDLPPVRGYSQSLLVPSKSNPKLWIGEFLC